MMTNVKEINKEFKEANRHFKKAIELGKKNLIIGQVNFPGIKKESRMRKAKVTPDPEGKEGT
jgi:hypothetical protein